MLYHIVRFMRDEEGVSMLEYALIAGFISIVAIAALALMKPDVEAIWDKLQKETAKAKP